MTTCFLLVVAVQTVLADGDRAPGEIEGPGIHYASYYGGWGEDMPSAIHVDQDGNVYIAAHISDDFPVTHWMTDKSGSGYMNVIFKVDGATGDLISSMCFDMAHVNGMTTDENGSLYVTGTYSGAGLETNYYAYSQDPFGMSDVFVTKFDPNGTKIEYSTYIGGSDNDAGQSIVVDGEGNAYIFGQTRSTDFPTEDRGVHAPAEGGYDNFVLKLGSRGQEILGTQAWGSEEDEYAWYCRRGPDGYLYLTGGTKGTGLTTVSSGYRSPDLGGMSIYVASIDLSDLGMEYLAIVGGTSDDGAAYLTVDAEGAVYVAATTRSSDFPWTDGSLKMTPMNGTGDGVVFKLDPTGTDLEHSARFGGRAFTGCYGIDFTSDGALMIAGTTSSPDFPATEGAINPDAMGQSDVFYLEMSADGRNLHYATFLGSFMNDYTVRPAWGPDAAYLLFFTYSPFIEVTDTAMQEEKDGHGDSFLMVIDRAPPSVSEDWSPSFATDLHPYGFAMHIEDNLHVWRACVEYWTGSGPHSVIDLELIEGTGREGIWIAFAGLDGVTEPLHYVVHVQDPTGHETVTLEVDRPGDSELPSMTEDGSDTEAVLGKTFTFRISVRDNVGIREVRVRIGWMGTSETHKMEMVEGAYVLTVDVPRDAAERAAAFMVVDFDVVDMALNHLTVQRQVPLVNLPPDVQPLPKWEVRPKVESMLDLAPYLSDGNDDIANLTIRTDVAEVEVAGTVLYALFNKDFDRKKVTVEVDDGDNRTLTVLTIVNPDASDDSGGLPGPTIPMVLVALLASTVLIHRRPRGNRRVAQYPPQRGLTMS